MYDLTFITINYNGLQDTCQLIDSILANIHGIAYEIVVVDNASLLDEAAQLRNRYPEVKVISSPVNLGFAGGNNLGLSHASGQYLMFINNDTIVPDSSVTALIQRIKADSSIGIVCPKIKFSWDRSIIQYAGFTPLSPITLRNQGIGYAQRDEGQYQTARPTAFVHGAAMLTSRHVLSKVGPMPEQYFLYYEEIDWSEEFHRQGFQIWYEPLCTIYHKESKATGTNSPLKAYYLTRNRLLFARRRRHGLTRLLSLAYITAVTLLRGITASDRPLARAAMLGLRDYYTSHDIARLRYDSATQTSKEI